MALALAFNAAGIPWYLSGFAATFAAYPLVALRKRWPPRPLPGREKALKRDEGWGMRDEKEKTRRERKRERQMSAFRRSIKKG